MSAFKFNRKTLSLERFISYLEKKYEVYGLLADFYRQACFQKTKWHIHINTQRSESLMLNRFEEKFGPPDKVVIGFGDWDQGSRQMKFHEPTKGKGMRKLFRKAGYQVYLVDEYHTSCQCYNCARAEGRCEPFREVVNPRPWRREERPLVTCHGLVKCKTCRRLWNRDVNSSLNILRIMKYRARDEDRPLYLRRRDQ